MKELRFIVFLVAPGLQLQVTVLGSDVRDALDGVLEMYGLDLADVTEAAVRREDG